MSGSPVYIDGRLVGALSYRIGQFAKEPIAGLRRLSRCWRCGMAADGVAAGMKRSRSDAAE